MSAQVIRPADVAVVERGGDVRTHNLVTPATGATQFLTGTTEFPPGSGLAFHSHNCEESVLILEGEAVFDCEESSIDMDAGDITWVPADTVHRFRNRGQTVMRILWIYGRTNMVRTIAD
jgi:quercetin dioxygenase-like cupin family protein